jgi:hypothetical protein
MPDLLDEELRQPVTDHAFILVSGASKKEGGLSAAL